MSYYFFTWNNASKSNEVNFKAKQIDGSIFELKHYKGKYVLVDFWGSWCYPCRSDNRKLTKIHKDNPSLIIVTIALEKVYNNGILAAQKDGFTWDNQIVEEHQFVIQSTLARKFGVSSIPTKFLITPKGKLLKNLSFNEISEIIQSK